MAELAATPERSLVSILVVDTVGSTNIIADMDPDDAQALLDGIYDFVRRTVERAGGVLVSFAGDGGVAVFGWPGSQEDHADRATATAWELQHSPEKEQDLVDPGGQPIQFRIGIHSGLVGLRQLRLQGGAVLDLVGGTVHLAAALEKRAPKGGIVLSSATAGLSRSLLVLSDVQGFPALETLGARPHLLLARPVRMKSADLIERYRKPLVGRDAQLEDLTGLLPRRGAVNNVVGIIGDPGVGKSHLLARLLQEAALEPQTMGILLHSGEGRNRSTAFAAVCNVLAQALGLSPSAAFGEVATQFGELGIEVAGEDLDLLRAIWPDSSNKSSPNPAQGGRVASQILAQTISDQPTILVIDDIQDVDPESLDALSALVAMETEFPVMAVMIGRPEAMATARKHAHPIIVLDVLDETALIEIARGLPGADKLDAATLRKAAERSGGIPFVLEQVIASVVEEGTAALSDIPQGVENIIHARLNRLDETTKSHAQALAVLGHTVDLELARIALDLPADRMQVLLTELDKADFIHPPLADRVQFRHAILADACANTVGRGRQKALHRKAMESVQKLHPTLDGVRSQIAYHAERAGEPALALDHLWEAAKRASRNWATGSLQRLFEQALPCIEALGASAEKRFVDFVLLTYTPSLQLGEFTRLNDHLPRALEIARRLDDPAQICGVQCQIAIIAWFEGRYEEGMPIASEATAIAHKLGHPAYVFSAQLLLASIKAGLAQLDEAIDLQRELVEMLKGDLRLARLGSAGIPASISNGYLNWFLIEQGRYEEALPYAEEAVAIALEADDLYSRVLGELSLGRNLMLLGRNSDAESVLRSSFDLAVQYGFLPAATHVGGLLAATLARLGRGQEGIDIIDSLPPSQIAGRCGELERFHHAAGHAEALAAIGNTKAAFERVDEAMDAALAINNQCLIAQGFALSVRLRLARDPQDEKGLRDLDRLNGLCARYSVRPFLPETLRH